MNETKKLYRLDHGALAGVCGGVAEYFNVDANLVRSSGWRCASRAPQAVALCGGGLAAAQEEPRSTPAGEDNGKYGTAAAPRARRASVIGIRRRH